MSKENFEAINKTFPLISQKQAELNGIHYHCYSVSSESHLKSFSSRTGTETFCKFINSMKRGIPSVLSTLLC